MNEQHQNLISDHPKKYAYQSESKQISFRVGESGFTKLGRSAETLQVNMPTLVKAKAQNACPVAPKVVPDIIQATTRGLVKAGENVNRIARWCNIHQHDVAPDGA